MATRRNTIQRQLVYNGVKELNIHATAEQVYEYVIATHPTISKATVYRNLSQMTESGELLNIGNHYGSTHYDHNCHEHHHFICEDCRRVFDVEGDFSKMLDRMSGINGFEIKNINLSLSGLCEGCKSKKIFLTAEL